MQGAGIRRRGLSEVEIVGLIQTTKMVRNALLALGVALLAGQASAAQLGEYRYRSWIDDSNVIFRFDNQTGDIEKLVKANAGLPMWVKCEIQPQKGAPSAVQTMAVAPSPWPAAAAPAMLAQNNNFGAQSAQPRVAQLIEPMMPTAVETMAYKAEPVAQKASMRAPRLYNEFDVEITDDINDADRTACRSQISAYEKSLSFMSTIGIGGDRTTGILTIANNGSRRIKMLEVSVCASKAGKDKPEVLHRVLFADKPNCEKPPAPSENGAKAAAVMKRVDIPTPSGSISGKPDVRVTYIKFEE